MKDMLFYLILNLLPILVVLGIILLIAEIRFRKQVKALKSQYYREEERIDSFEKELGAVEFKHSGAEEDNIKGKLRMLYNTDRTEESEKTFNDLLDKLNVKE